MIQVKYKNTKEELIELYMQNLYSDKSYLKQIKTRRIISTLVAFTFVALFIYFIVQYYLSGYMHQSKLSIFFAIMFFLMGLWAIFFYQDFIKKLNRRAIAKKIEGNTELLNNHIEITLSEDSLKVLTTDSGYTSEKNINLDEISSFKIIDNYIYITIRKISSLYIPCATFETQEDREKFKNILLKYSNNK